MDNLTGQSLGRYHILEQLGEGGMAVVYKGYDMRLESNVAIKFIRTEKLTLETAGKTRQRFEREARALANLTHPNIVKVIDYGEFEGQPYLVMPFLSGGTLKNKLSGNPVPYQTAAKILIPIARALDYAHKQRMIHRDVKPSNILLTESGEPMLSDFGVAKILEEETTSELTGTGVGIGSPEYMAPEQAEKSIDHRADIYSLGTVFYELITGRKPYKADTPLAILIKRASEPLPRPKKFVPNLPNRVEQVLLKVLARDPSERYSDSAEFADVLEKLVIAPDSNLGMGSFLKTPLFSLTIFVVFILTAGLLTGYRLGYLPSKAPPPVINATSTDTALPLEPATLGTSTAIVLLEETSTAAPQAIIASPKLEPQFDPNDPDGFLRWYFHSLWTDRNYETLWDYISVDLRERLGVDYPAYAANWEKIGSISEPITIIFDRKDGDRLVYHVKYTTFSRKSGLKDQRNDGYYLFFNSSKGHWEFR